MTRILAVVVGTVAGCHDARPSSPPAPAFDLVSIDGQPVRSVDLAGKIVLIDLWASWCQPCVKGMPAIIDTAGKLGDKLAIVAVALDNADTSAKNAEADLRAFVAEHHLAFPVVEVTPRFNADYGAVLKLGGGKIVRDDHMVAANLPTWIVIDQAGRVAGTYTSSDDEPKMLAQLELLAKR